MDSMQFFWNTVAIVFGILSPLLAVLWLMLVVRTARVMGESIKLKAEEIRKQPPFTDVEVNVNPVTNVMTVRMLKDDDIIWEGASSRNRLQDDGILEFKSTEEGA